MIEPNEKWSASYRRAAHALQTATKLLAQYKPPADRYLDNRMGLNTALAEAYGMAKLLMEKGIISQEEYETAMLSAVEEEVERHKRWIEEATGGALKASSMTFL